MTLDPTAGTTLDGNAAVTQTAGTGADGNAQVDERITKLEQEKAQWLAEKTNYERTKADLDAANQRIEAISQPPASAVDPITADVQSEYMNLLMQAAAGDPRARFQLAVLQGQQQEMARIRRDAMLSSLPNDERSEVEQVLQKNPALDVPTARAIAQGNQSAKKLRDYEAREAEAKRMAEEAARAGTPGASTVRPAPAAELKNGLIKASELAARYAALNQRVRDGDQKARAEARELGRQIDAGEIKTLLNE
jgi:hypothetical protein